MSTYYIAPSIGLAPENIENHLLIYDTLKPGHHDHLKWYFNDLYQFFLFKLASAMNASEQISDEEQKRLARMLADLIEAKNIIEGKED